MSTTNVIKSVLVEGRLLRVLGETEHTLNVLDESDNIFEVVKENVTNTFSKLLPRKKRKRVSAKTIAKRKEVAALPQPLQAVSNTIEKWKQEFKLKNK